MEKITTVIISGKEFKLSSKAYNLIKNYDKFLSVRDVDENKTFQIETQMSSLLEMSLEYSDTDMVNEEMIKEAIKIIGENEKLKYVESSFNKNERVAGENRIYKTDKNKVIGGVCTGIAEYFNIDPVIIRILFIIGFFFAIGTLVYIVLYLFLPKKNIENQKSIIK